MLNYKHIVIEGNIGAGKTTLANFIAKEFDSSLLLEEFEENDFLKEFYNNEDFVLHAEVQFILDRSKQLFQFHKQKHQAIVTDYIPSKSLIFSKMNLSKNDFNLVENLVQSLFKTLPQPDIMLFLERPVQQLKENILKRGREYETNISNAYLQKVEDAYTHFLKQQQEFPVLLINADEIDLSNPTILKEKIAKLLQANFENRVKKVSLL
ncbi:MAG: deoxynucleoside kinase [Flavobacteriales bacterium]|jgi:deoxyadenosine/deoxycytidine kinase|nr:deoxynucleoside kinase [Flavobacteriales bacterium]